MQQSSRAENCSQSIQAFSNYSTPIVRRGIQKPQHAYLDTSTPLRTYSTPRDYNLDSLDPSTFICLFCYNHSIFMSTIYVLFNRRQIEIVTPTTRQSHYPVPVLLPLLYTEGSLLSRAFSQPLSFRDATIPSLTKVVRTLLFLSAFRAELWRLEFDKANVAVCHVLGPTSLSELGRRERKQRMQRSHRNKQLSILDRATTVKTQNACALGSFFQ